MFFFFSSAPPQTPVIALTFKAQVLALTFKAQVLALTFKEKLQ